MAKIMVMMSTTTMMTMMMMAWEKDGSQVLGAPQLSINPHWSHQCYLRLYLTEQWENVNKKLCINWPHRGYLRLYLPEIKI